MMDLRRDCGDSFLLTTIVIYTHDQPVIDQGIQLGLQPIGLFEISPQSFLIIINPSFMYFEND